MKFEKISQEDREKLERRLYKTIVEEFRREKIKDGYYKYIVSLQEFKFITDITDNELKESISIAVDTMEELKKINNNDGMNKKKLKEIQDKEHRGEPFETLNIWNAIVTEEIDIWLNMLVKEYEMILKGKEQETENAFVDHIFNTMEYLNSFYGRIYLFKEFYNALLNNSHEVRYQAILDLLDKFGEKNKEIGRVYQKYGNKEWCILSKNLKCNRGRMEIKRIIGVMANKELRKKYFGF